MLNSNLFKEAHKMAKEIKIEYNFEKNGLECKFKNPKLDRNNKLVLEWKVIGSKDSENNKFSGDGYFGNAELDIKQKAIRCNFKFGKKKIAGVRPPEDIFNELCSIFYELKEKRNNGIFE